MALLASHHLCSAAPAVAAAVDGRRLGANMEMEDRRARAGRFPSAIHRRPERMVVGGGGVTGRGPLLVGFCGICCCMSRDKSILRQLVPLRSGTEIH